MAKNNYYGLIMAGGRGTRFWPRSRKRSAKQVLKFFGERSLIQQTVDRLKPVLAPERVWIITNEFLRDEIVRQLPEVPPKQILAEPAQRNTAPCIGLAGHLLNSIDKDAVMGVFPADHIIEKPAAYLKAVRPAFQAAEAGKIAVIGIKPRWPETGYGYVEFEKGVTEGVAVQPVLRFREKPDADTARQFVDAGCFYWNAGMFFWRASVVLDSLRQHLPKTATLLAGLPNFGSRAFSQKLADAYPRCENISIDYAVLEKAKQVVGVPAPEFGWNDVGSWNAVYELSKRDRDGNALTGDVLSLDSTGSYAEARGKRLIALVGVKDIVVVDTGDAVLVMDRNQAQKAGDVVKALEKAKRENLI